MHKKTDNRIVWLSVFCVDIVASILLAPNSIFLERLCFHLP